MLTRLNELKDREVPLHRAIISDILLWIVLVGVLAVGVYLFAVRIPERRGQTITLHFKDVNEIGKGSAVRMMGTEIGYVEDLHIRPDHVALTIQTYPKTLPIPSGATFTVLFTGLAGAKSIEIELPDDPKPVLGGRPIYIVEEPIRMKDTVNYTIDITQAMQKGAENITDFFGKKKPVEELQFNIQQAHRWVSASSGFMDDLEAGIVIMQADVHNNAGEASDTLAAFNVHAKRIVNKTDPARLKPKVQDAFNGIRKVQSLFVAQTTGTVNTITIYDRLAKLNATNAQLSAWMQKTKQTVIDFDLGNRLLGLDNGIARFLAFMNQADGFFEKDHLPAMRRARVAIRNFNGKVTDWNIKADQAKREKALEEQQEKIQTEKTPEEQSITIVDRNGTPVESTQPRWWVQPSTAVVVKPAETTMPPVISTEEKSSWLGRLFRSVGHFFSDIWDGIMFLFQ